MQKNCLDFLKESLMKKNIEMSVSCKCIIDIQITYYVYSDKICLYNAVSGINIKKKKKKKKKKNYR